MPDATTLEFLKFQTDLENIEDKWDTFTITPYTRAYNRAHDAFKQTLETQTQLEQQRLELALTALSICGGGLLTSVFADAVLKNIVADATVGFICHHNLERAFNVAHWVSKNKTATFVLGELWDQGQSLLSSTMKDALKPDGNAFPSLKSFVRDPFDLYLQLTSFIGEAKTKLHDVASEVRDNATLSDVEKLAALAKLRRGQLMSPGSQSVDDGTLAERIELSFYMNLVLDSDRLEFFQVWSGGRHYFHNDLGQTRILRMPSSPHYPRATSDPHGTPSREGGTCSQVVYDGIGSKVVERIDGLYRRRFGRTFFTKSADWFGNQAPDHGLLLRAEQSLTQLAAMSIQSGMRDCARPATAGR